MIDFILDLAVFHLLYYYIWKYVFLYPIIGIQSIFNINDWFTLIIKAIGTIVFSSLFAMIVLKYYSGVSTLIIYSLLAIIIMLFILVGGTVQAQENANLIEDSKERFKMLMELELDVFYYILALIIFVLTLFIPAIGMNPINKVFILIINWLMDMKYVGYFITGLALLILISYLNIGLKGLKRLIFDKK